ncbi:MAG: hypothetical protein V2I36_19205 [Desulfopila sp.]|jgi:hypothetical protein|nr:hypothetical protein [Desulfopila sp.]
MTSEGVRPAPPVEDILIVLRGGEGFKRKKEDQQRLLYPVLLLSLECPFSPAAKNFWSRIADENNIELPVKIAEKEENLTERYGVTGYPCLVRAPGLHYYGVHFTHEEAKAIVSGTPDVLKK